MKSQRGKPLHVVASKAKHRNGKDRNGNGRGSGDDKPKNDHVAAIGRRLRDARLALSAHHGFPVSQQMIAEALHVANNSIGRFENGIREPDVLMIVALAQVLKTAPCWLMFGCAHPMTPALHPPRAQFSGMQLLEGPAIGNRPKRVRAGTTNGRTAPTRR